MLHFTSIATELQLMIAEKIQYFDLEQFELSSKHAHKVASAIKYYPAIPVNIHSQMDNFIIYVQKGTKLKCIYWSVWSVIQQISYLPRLIVNELQLSHGTSLDSISDFCEQAKFVRNKVSLIWIGDSPNPKFFAKVSTALLISSFCATEPLDPEFLPLLSAVEFVHIPTGDKYEALLHLNCKRLRVYDNDDPSRIATLANLYLQEWVLKKRDIEWFRAFTRHGLNLNKERILDALEFTAIWEYSGFKEEYRMQTDQISSNNTVYHRYANATIFVPLTEETRNY